ncbi:MAG TPA: HNH endonuclease signature motif containing protein, partial [Polyangiaceae bacterium]|nr:HNH endonuclease signature motif containing protein [Polyangiaceae bacterium]
MSTPSSDPFDSPLAPLGAPLGAPLESFLAPPASSLPTAVADATPEAPPVPTDPTEMRAGLGGDEVRLRLARAARHEETGRRVLAFYLVEMEARRLYQATGHGSTAYYAETRLGLDRRRVAELLRVGAKLLELREVDRALCEGRLGWAKVLIVARMATPEHEAAWLERALALDVRTLTLLAASSREGGPPRAAGDEKGLPEIRFPVSASLSPLVYAKLEQAQRRLGDELGRPVDVAGLLDVLLDQYHSTEADGSVPGRRPVDASIYHVQLYESGKRGDPLLVETEDGPMPVDGGGAGPEGAISEAIRCDAGVRNHYVAGAHGHDHGHDHRARDVKTPSRMREHVLRRDGRRCRSCRSRKSLMVHHIEFRSHGGRTLPSNLLGICFRCHGLVHAGLLRIEGASVHVARFVDASGTPVGSPAQIRGLEIALLTPPAPVETTGATTSATSSATPGAALVEVASPGEGYVTLASIPAEVDATWWRRHAHLVRDRGERGNLSFTAGTPEEVPPPDVPALAPATEAFAGLVGQEERIRRLRGTAEGVRAQGRRFPHTLLTGPA